MYKVDMLSNLEYFHEVIEIFLLDVMGLTFYAHPLKQGLVWGEQLWACGSNVGHPQ